jgi:hypothetical protein
MMNTMKSLLAATVAVSLGACVQQDAGPKGIDKAIPTSDQVSIKLPDGQARAVGDLASYYVVTRDVTRNFNGGTAWVLVLIHSIVQYPVTSINGDVYTWGPWSGSALDPATYKLDVTANADGTFDYSLSGKSKSDPNAVFEAVISGHADPTPGELQGNGEFLIDFDASKRVNPVDNGNNKGQVDVNYDLATRHLDLHIMSTDASGAPVSADYAYDDDASGGGNMTFDVTANVGGTALNEDVTMRSRWLADGEGRGDFRIAGGDLGSAQAIGSQCWSQLFRETYYTDNANFMPTEGDPASCAFTTADLPPAH